MVILFEPCVLVLKNLLEICLLSDVSRLKTKLVLSFMVKKLGTTQKKFVYK